MALTEEQIRKATEELKAKEKEKSNLMAKKEQKASVGKSAVSDNKAEDGNKVSLEMLMKKMNEMQAQLDDKTTENKNLRHKLNKRFDGKTFLQTQEAMNEVLRDNDPRYFIKHYDIKVEGQNDISFDVKMHAPSAMELSAIEQELADMTNGRADGFNTQSYVLFRAISYFKIVGDICPDWFKDLDKCYRWDIVVNAFVDFENWEESFRFSQRH